MDGYVILAPVDEFLLDGGGNDVPVIIGTNEQEIDCCAAQNLNGFSIPKYDQFIRDR